MAFSRSSSVASAVVVAAELQAREERFPEDVAAEGTGLAYQSMDNVSVVDAVRIAPDQALHHRDALAFVVELDEVGMQAHSQLAADQSRGYRVGVLEDAHRARPRDRRIRLPVRRQRAHWQCPQVSTLLLDPRLSSRVTRLHAAL